MNGYFLVSSNHTKLIGSLHVAQVTEKQSLLILKTYRGINGSISAALPINHVEADSVAGEEGEAGQRLSDLSLGNL